MKAVRDTTDALCAAWKRGKGQAPFIARGDNNSGTFSS